MTHISLNEEEIRPPRAWQVWALAGLLGAALGWFLAAAAIIEAGGHPFGGWPEAWRYADGDQPMIFSADGFYYLHQAETALGGASMNVPPFSRLTALISKLSSRPATWAAFYMSLFVHLALGLVTAAWGRRLKAGLVGVFLAALAAALMPAWMERAGPGEFDTDMAIVLFWQSGLFFLAAAGPANWSARRFFDIPVALICFALLVIFWKPGLGLALASLGTWAMLLPPIGIWRLKARLAVVGLASVWLALLVFLPPAKAPAPGFVMEYFNSHFALAFGVRDELFYASIKELSSLNYLSFMEEVGGNPAGALGFLAAGILLAARRPAARLPLLLALLCIVAGFKSNRMIYLGSFPLALALGCLPSLLAETVLGRLPRLNCRAGWAAGLLLSLALLAACLHWALNRELDIRWERGHDRLAEALRAESGGAGTAKLWNWWDDGYFLAARSGGMTPLFDGGSQTHIIAYIAARPFLMGDRRAASRWMRFFAIRGERGLAPMFAIWGLNGAYNILELVFSTEDRKDLPANVSQKAKKLPGGLNWFFPKGKVYWYLQGNFFKISNWWVPLGLSRKPDKDLVRPHLETIGRNQFLYDEAQKSLTVAQDLWDRGYKNFGGVFNASKTSLAPPWPDGGAPYIVYSDTHKNAYITDELGFKTLPLLMMISGGYPAHFRPVAFDEDWGGVWEVLP